MLLERPEPEGRMGLQLVRLAALQAEEIETDCYQHLMLLAFLVAKAQLKGWNCRAAAAEPYRPALVRRRDSILAWQRLVAVGFP